MTTTVIEPPKVPDEILLKAEIEKLFKDAIPFYGIVVPLNVFGGLEQTIITVNLPIPKELQPELTSAIKSHRPYPNPQIFYPTLTNYS